MSYHLAPFYHNNWSPFGGLGDWSGLRLNRDMRMLQRMMDTDMTEAEAGTTSTVEPSYNFQSDEHGAHFEIEMPGVAKENISIEATGHKLVVKGKRFKRHLTGHHDTVVEEEGKEGEESTKHPVKKTDVEPSLIYLLEARLAHGADVENIKADHCDGVLTVTIPLKADKGARRIQIGG